MPISISNIFIRSSDLDEVEAYISECYAPVTVLPRQDSREFGIIGQGARVGTMRLEWSQIVGSYSVKAREEFDASIFNIVAAGHFAFQLPDRQVNLSSGQAVAYSGASEAIMSPAKLVSLTMPNPYLHRRLSVLLDGSGKRNLEFGSEVLNTSRVAPFAGLLFELETSSFLKLDPRVFQRSTSLTDAVVDALLMCVPNNCSDLLHRSVPSIAPRQVKRALDYIHSDPRIYRDPDELAALSGVSIRSLQYSFKETTGYSISEYQMMLRLHGARQELAIDETLSISDVAQGWGFHSASHFTRRFKEFFGAPPSKVRK